MTDSPQFGQPQFGQPQFGQPQDDQPQIDQRNEAMQTAITQVTAKIGGVGITSHPFAQPYGLPGAGAACLRAFVCCAAVGMALLVQMPAAAQVAVADDVSATAAAFAEVMAKTYAADEPGAAAIVVQGERVLYRGARGLADVELGVPLEPDMVFRLGSITKQFTGAAIRLLELEGQLSLDDSLHKFFPTYPEGGKGVTVEHLLAHTSGIKSYTSIPGYMDQEIRRDLSTEELMEVFAELPSDFAPGERFLYNNSGYVLLGAIIEAVTGKSYAEFIEERIFAPLGMQRSLYDVSEEIVPGRAKGYELSPEGWRNAPFLSMTQPHAAGSLASTVDDLVRWNAALVSGKLMKPEDAEALWTSFETNDGESVDYGYGFGFSDVRGHDVVQHGGGIHGFRTYALRVPDADLYVAVLANNTDPKKQPSRVATELAAIALGDPFPQRTAIELPKDVLQRYVGVYRINEDEVRTIGLAEDGSLYSQRTGGPRSTLLAESETRFFYEDSHTYLDFVRNESGEITHMLVYQNGAKKAERAERTNEAIVTREKVELTAERAQQYAGTYKMLPGFEMTIRVEGSRVFSQLPGQPEVELFAEADDAFFLEVVDAQVTFERDEAGVVSKVTIHQGGRKVPGARVVN